MDSRKYYYLKLKENFFESDSMILLENMKDGYLYSNILLKLYLRSLKNSGRLMLNNVIPYNAQMLASVTRHQVGTVEKALEIFKELGLIEILDTGAIYMTDIQNFIGESSNVADRQRAYRARISNEQTCQQMSQQKLNKRKTNVTTNMHQRLEIEIEKDIEKEIYTKKDKDMCTKTEVLEPPHPPKKKQTPRFVPPTVEEVRQYCRDNDYSVDAQRFVDFYECKGWMVGKNKMKNWKAAVRTWVKKDQEGVKKDEPREPTNSVRIWQ